MNSKIKREQILNENKETKIDKQKVIKRLNNNLPFEYTSEELIDDYLYPEEELDKTIISKEITIDLVRNYFEVTTEEQEEIFDLLYPDIEKAVEKKIIN